MSLLVSESVSSKLETSSLDAVREQALSCMACRLGATRTNVVFSDGNPEAKLMFIGEGPGQHEDESGVPFVGRAGQLLTKIIESAQFDRQRDTYICNIVKCRPPGNRVPMADEAEACFGYLKAQIQLVKPKIIVLVGKTALKGTLGVDGPIGKIRGQWLDVSALAPHVAADYDGIQLMTIFHPSYLLRNPSPNEGTPKWLTWQDMLEVRRVYDALN